MVVCLIPPGLVPLEKGEPYILDSVLASAYFPWLRDEQILSLFRRFQGISCGDTGVRHQLETFCLRKKTPTPKKNLRKKFTKKIYEKFTKG